MLVLSRPCLFLIRGSLSSLSSSPNQVPDKICRNMNSRISVEWEKKSMTKTILNNTSATLETLCPKRDWVRKWSLRTKSLSGEILFPFDVHHISCIWLSHRETEPYLGTMNFEMFCKISLIFVSLAALVALEWSLPRMRPHVALQITRISASVVALVTLERLFSGVLCHHVNLQITNCNARILARCASVWLFFRVRPLVSLQRAWFCCFVIALIAMVKISLVCIFLCLIRWLDRDVLYSHWLHWCSFSPVCFLIWVLREKAVLHE